MAMTEAKIGRDQEKGNNMYSISDVVELGEAGKVILCCDIKYESVLDDAEPLTFPPEEVFDSCD